MPSPTVRVLPVVGAIKTWAESHIDDIEAARQAYDATAPT